MLFVGVQTRNEYLLKLLNDVSVSTDTNFIILVNLNLKSIDWENLQINKLSSDSDMSNK